MNRLNFQKTIFLRYSKNRKFSTYCKISSYPPRGLKGIYPCKISLKTSRPIRSFTKTENHLVKGKRDFCYILLLNCEIIFSFISVRTTLHLCAWPWGTSCSCTTWSCWWSSPARSTSTSSRTGSSPWGADGQTRSPAGSSSETELWN